MVRNNLQADRVRDVVAARDRHVPPLIRRDEVVIRIEVVAARTDRAIGESTQARRVPRLEVAVVVERQAARVDRSGVRDAIAVRVGNAGVEVVVDLAIRTGRDNRREVPERVAGVVGDPAPRRRARSTRQNEQRRTRNGRGQVGRDIILTGVVVVIDHRLVARDVTVALADRVAGVVAGEEGQVAAVVTEVAAEQALDVEFTAITMFGDAVLRRNFHALVVVFEDEVHDAGHGVRTVHRRGAAGNDVHALDEAGRDSADVDNAGGRRSGNALAVDEDQGALRPETTKVEGREVFTALVVRSAGVARNKLRKFVQQGFDGDRTGQVELLRIDGRDRARTFEVRTHDARAGDDDGIIFVGLVFRVGDGSLLVNRRLSLVRRFLRRGGRGDKRTGAENRESLPGGSRTQIGLPHFILPNRGARFRTPQVRGRNPPPRKVRLAWKGGPLSSATERACSFC